MEPPGVLLDQRDVGERAADIDPKPPRHDFLLHCGMEATGDLVTKYSVKCENAGWEYNV